MKISLRVGGSLLLTLAVAALAVAGCGKSQEATDRTIPGQVDLVKFQQAFPAPSPQQQDSISQVAQGLRYGSYPQALSALGKLAADPTLTEPQKKAVNDLVQGIKDTMAKAPAPAAK